MGPEIQFNLFAYGTLMVPELIRSIIDRDLKSGRGRLNDFERRSVRNEIYPAVKPSLSNDVFGVIYYDLSLTEMNILDQYEGNMYERQTVSVCTGRNSIERCQVYACKPVYYYLLEEKAWDPSILTGLDLRKLLE